MEEYYEILHPCKAGSKIVFEFIIRSLIVDCATICINRLKPIDNVTGNHNYIRCVKEIHREVKLMVLDYSRIELWCEVMRLRL
ncbi:MAG: hypothetical protein DRO40_10335 [Thermoprotei archaeon]|nr:MAG: hypothetical protein DRO40_10335 [Thermoprotei archaeon]